MRNFIILFRGKEGTSPIVRLLDNFDQISILHQENGQGWEPYDAHNCGNMSTADVIKSIRSLYDKEGIDLEALNQTYLKTASRSLEIDRQENTSIGFKMRPYRPRRSSSVDNPIHLKLAKRFFGDQYDRAFETSFYTALKELNVKVFVMVRRDLLRWSLSKYHGDGSSKSKGHLQFKVAQGKATSADLQKFHVDIKRLEEIFEKFQKEHEKKVQLIQKITSFGHDLTPIYYEDFLEDNITFFQRFGEEIELSWQKDDVQKAIQRGAYFKKVHSTDIREMILNPDEVLEKYEDKGRGWWIEP